MKKIFPILMLLFSVLSFAQTPMTKAEIKDFVYNVIMQNKKIKTLQNDFVQTKKMDFLEKEIVTSGTMAMQSPNLLSWKYTKPYQYSVVFKNNKIYINNQGTKSTVNMKNEAFEKINQMMTGSATGQIFLDKDFEISYYKTANSNMAKFVPKVLQMKKYIKEIELFFPKNQATVSQVIMHEASGDNTIISFKNTKLNANIPASVFAQ